MLISLLQFFAHFWNIITNISFRLTINNYFHSSWLQQSSTLTWISLLSVLSTVLTILVSCHSFSLLRRCHLFICRFSAAVTSLNLLLAATTSLLLSLWHRRCSQLLSIAEFCPSVCVYICVCICSCICFCFELRWCWCMMCNALCDVWCMILMYINGD